MCFSFFYYTCPLLIDHRKKILAQYSSPFLAIIQWIKNVCYILHYLKNPLALNENNTCLYSILTGTPNPERRFQTFIVKNHLVLAYRKVFEHTYLIITQMKGEGL